MRKVKLDPRNIIRDIIDADLKLASSLRHLGINFFDFPHLSIEEIALKFGIPINILIKKIQADLIHSAPVDLDNCKIETVITYLKYTHRNFIGQKFPFIKDLIAVFDPSNLEEEKLKDDLQVIFPYFVEDFRKHIQEEEETLFNYILELSSQTNKQHFYNCWRLLNKYSVKSFAAHHIGTDELSGIRSLCNGFITKPNESLVKKVLFNELKSFDEELKNHAIIEDDILIPAAIKLEQKVKIKIKHIQKHN